MDNDAHCQFSAGRTATLRLILFGLLILILPILAIVVVARLRRGGGKGRGAVIVIFSTRWHDGDILDWLRGAGKR
jgi:hypothetical protein